jgi:uncharacterized protein YjgD (DUF1641 family)
MHIEPNSSEAMVLMMLSAMHMDGKVVFRELELYGKVAHDLGIDDETFAYLVAGAEQEPALSNRKAIEAITDPAVQRSIYALMSAIALIDGEFHTFEQILLDRLRSIWKL